jgi:hypothetical protein
METVATPPNVKGLMQAHPGEPKFEHNVNVSRELEPGY